MCGAALAGPHSGAQRLLFFWVRFFISTGLFFPARLDLPRQDNMPGRSNLKLSKVSSDDDDDDIAPSSNSKKKNRSPVVSPRVLDAAKKSQTRQRRKEDDGGGENEDLSSSSRSARRERRKSQRGGAGKSTPGETKEVDASELDARAKRRHQRRKSRSGTTPGHDPARKGFFADANSPSSGTDGFSSTRSPNSSSGRRGGRAAEETEVEVIAWQHTIKQRASDDDGSDVDLSDDDHHNILDNHSDNDDGPGPKRHPVAKSAGGAWGSRQEVPEDSESTAGIKGGRPVRCIALRCVRACVASCCAAPSLRCAVACGNQHTPAPDICLARLLFLSLYLSRARARFL